MNRHTSSLLGRWTRSALATSVVAFMTAGVSASGAEEPLRTALNEYTDFLDTLDESHGFTPQEVGYWVGRIEPAIPSSTSDHNVDMGWIVIISLLNTQRDWVNSESACEAAIATAASDHARFRRIYDLYTVQRNMNNTPPEGGAAPAPAFETAERLVSMFDDLWGEDGSVAAAKKWSTYASVASALTRNPGTAPARVVELCETLVTRASNPLVQAKINPGVIQMFRGRAAGVLLCADAERACEVLTGDLTGDEGTAFPPDAIAVGEALRRAQGCGAGFAERNALLWCATEFLTDYDRLNLGAGHVSAALRAESERGKVDLLPGSRDTIQGIPIEDLIHLIEPPLADMIAADGIKPPGFSASQDAKHRHELLRTGAAVLGDLLRIAGDEEGAGYYASLFPIDRRP